MKKEDFLKLGLSAEAAAAAEAASLEELEGYVPKGQARHCRRRLPSVTRTLPG